MAAQGSRYEYRRAFKSSLARRRFGEGNEQFGEHVRLGLDELHSST